MITYRDYNRFSNGKVMVTAVGLSTDSKPTEGIANGSMFLEMDSKKIYLFDEAGSAWRQFS